MPRADRERRRRERRSARRGEQQRHLRARRVRDRWLTRGAWLGGSALLLAGLFWLAGALHGGSSSVDAATEALAREVSGGDVRTITGVAHTVYHSTPALPSHREPREDGRHTLVWFSGTFCHFCEEMEPFVYRVASRFSDRLVFVEKSVEHDRAAAARYGVRGTPTFVYIDASGNELARFHFQATAEAFAGAIESILGGSLGTEGSPGTSIPGS